MLGIYEDEQGELYRVTKLGDLQCKNPFAEGFATLASVCIYHPFHIDRDGDTLVMAVTEFQRHFRSVSPAEFEGRVKVALAAHEEKQRLTMFVHNPPKDGEIAGLPKKQ